MKAEYWTYLSAGIVGMSGFYYAIRAWQNRIYPNPVSWGVWAVVGLGLWLTADAAEAKAVYWSTLVGAWNPTMIALVVLWRVRNKGYTLARHEKRCLAFALTGYLLWFMVKDVPEVAPWSMYWMIAVDIFALWPTWEQVYSNPMSDKPFPWLVFAWGFGLSGLAVTDHTVANWALPIYMFFGAQIVALPMIIRRVRLKSPVQDWI
jgi:hypothetical protein